MRPPSNKGFSASNDSLFNAIDFFAPRRSSSQIYLDVPHGPSLPILNSLQRSFSPASHSSPEHENAILDDKHVQNFFQGNVTPDRRSSASEIQSVSSIYQYPYHKDQTNSIVPLQTNIVNRKSLSTTKSKLSLENSDPLYGEKWLPVFTVVPKASWSDSDSREKCKRFSKRCFCTIAFIVVIFVFLVTFELLSISWTLIIGKAYMNVLTHKDVSKNPLGILMFGILTGVFTDSFIYPSAIFAKLIETEKLPLDKSVFMLFGLHIGCTAASFFFSIIFFSSKHKLRRATGTASLYYIVNMMTVVILLPIEVIIGMVANLTELMLLDLKTWQPKNCQIVRNLVLGVTDYIVQINFQNGAKFEVDDFRWIRHCSQNHTSNHCVYLFQHPSLILSDGLIGLILLLIVILLWCLCIFALVKLTNVIFRGDSANQCQTIINKRWPKKFPWLGDFVVCLLATAITLILQNHSLIIILCTLLAARGVFGISLMFPIVFGCNLGNSLSLILISLNDQSDTFFHISLMCIVYNLFGFCAWFITPCFKRLMINAAAKLGDNIVQYQWLLPVLIALIYILVPAILTSLSAAGLGIFILVTAPLALIFFDVVAFNAILQYNPTLIPKRLRIWNFLPRFCHSLEPYNEIFSKYSNEKKLRRQQKRNEKIKQRHSKGDPLEFWERSRVQFYKTDLPLNQSSSVATRTGTMSSVYV